MATWPTGGCWELMRAGLGWIGIALSPGELRVRGGCQSAAAGRTSARSGGLRPLTWAVTLTRVCDVVQGHQRPVQRSGRTVFRQRGKTGPGERHSHADTHLRVCT